MAPWAWGPTLTTRLWSTNSSLLTKKKKKKSREHQTLTQPISK